MLWNPGMKAEVCVKHPTAATDSPLCRNSFSPGPWPMELGVPAVQGDPVHHSGEFCRWPRLLRSALCCGLSILLLAAIVFPFSNPPLFLWEGSSNGEPSLKTVRHAAVVSDRAPISNQRMACWSSFPECFSNQRLAAQILHSSDRGWIVCFSTHDKGSPGFGQDLTAWLWFHTNANIFRTL